jgi:acyl carrier protein
VLLAIEEKHGYKIPDEDVKLCKSIRSTLDYLANQK